MVSTSGAVCTESASCSASSLRRFAPAPWWASSSPVVAGASGPPAARCITPASSATDSRPAGVAYSIESQVGIGISNAPRYRGLGQIEDHSPCGDQHILGSALARAALRPWPQNGVPGGWREACHARRGRTGTATRHHRSAVCLIVSRIESTRSCL